MKNRDALLGKISNIRNCLASIKRATNLEPGSLDDLMKQDVFVLNLERAIQAAIDIANLLIAQNGWELPRSYKHGFQILERNQVLTSELTKQMSAMAGFRNIAVHDYAELDLNIMKSILTKNLVDIEDYCVAVHRAIQ
jgi:uncharacterized protein YutE (UPF0331/DUF86 family)